MIAIPAIDLIDGKVVRLFQGDYQKQTNYSLDPVEYAREIKQSGLEYLHLVDLSGAKSGRIIHDELLKRVVSETGLKVDFGGGVKTKEDLEKLFDKGANQVVIGSLCVKNPEMVVSWIEEFGTEKFILALDTDGTNLKINGWQDRSGLTLENAMKHFEAFENLMILTTDIRQDGTGKGPNSDLYRFLIQEFPSQKWIASGGVESIQDLIDLRETGCYGCVVGKALLEGKISLSELKKFNDAGL
ncbi:1-(5-phosphoribosyl)-5-[(5-phosphoribosylamino)methylideneamino] imidazole-4-carboxamide isomerase [compost metagenome]